MQRQLILQRQLFINDIFIPVKDTKNLIPDFSSSILYDCYSDFMFNLMRKTKHSSYVIDAFGDVLEGKLINKGKQQEKLFKQAVKTGRTIKPLLTHELTDDYHLKAIRDLAYLKYLQEGECSFCLGGEAIVHV